MSFADESDDYETYERNALATDDEAGDLPDRDGPTAEEIMNALNTLNLCQWNASQHPDDADLAVQEILARVRWEGVVAEVLAS